MQSVTDTVFVEVAANRRGDVLIAYDDRRLDFTAAVRFDRAARSLVAVLADGVTPGEISLGTVSERFAGRFGAVGEVLMVRPMESAYVEGKVALQKVN